MGPVSPKQKIGPTTSSGYIGLSLHNLTETDRASGCWANRGGAKVGMNIASKKKKEEYKETRKG